MESFVTKLTRIRFDTFVLILAADSIRAVQEFATAGLTGKIDSREIPRKKLLGGTYGHNGPKEKCHLEKNSLILEPIL